MTKRLFFTFLFIFSFLPFIFTKNVFADCSASWRNENNRDLSVCVGGLQSKDDVRKLTLNIECLDNSNLIGGGCRGITGPSSISLSGWSDNNISGSPGSYWACATMEGFNRAIGRAKFTFIDSGYHTYCSTTMQTAPKDWNPVTEGAPWHKGTTVAIKAGSILCPDQVSVNTALGCIPVQMDKFLAWLLPYLFGIGGTIAFVLMIFGFIKMTTSQGDPKAVEGARETITSAIIGLLVSIFAIFLLRLIAVDILHIPGIS